MMVVLVTLGAVNIGCDVLALASVTAGPESWRHAQVAMAPSGSDEARPSRTTSVRRLTVRSAPALATGARFVMVTVVVAGVELVNPSWTTRVTVKVPSAV